MLCIFAKGTILVPSLHELKIGYMSEKELKETLAYDERAGIVQQFVDILIVLFSVGIISLFIIGFAYWMAMI